jgi:hypothetical protein
VKKSGHSDLALPAHGASPLTVGKSPRTDRDRRPMGIIRRRGGRGDPPDAKPVVTAPRRLLVRRPRLTTGARSSLAYREATSAWIRKSQSIQGNRRPMWQ